MWGLDFEGEIEFIVEGYDAGVVVERRAQPGWGNFLRDLSECGQQALVGRDRNRAVRPRVFQADTSPEGLVHAVFRPGLGQGLEFGVGRIPPLSREVILNGPHLPKVEGEQSFSAETH